MVEAPIHAAFRQHMETPYHARLEASPYSFDRSETGQCYRVASVEEAFKIFVAGYRAASRGTDHG